MGAKGLQADAKPTKVAWPVFLFVLALATPPELSVSLGSLRISAYRAVLMAMFLSCNSRLFGRRCGKLHACDGLMYLHGVWALLAFIAYAGVGQGLESGGIYLVESVGAYLIGRCYLRNSRDFIAMTQLMLWVIICLVGIAMVESVTGNHFVREAFRSVLGGPSLKPIEPRLGLHRAYASFDHPILFGIFCSSTFGLAVYATPPRTRTGRRIIRGALAGLGTFFSLSAGAFSALGAQGFILGWDVVTRGIQRRWMVLGGIMAGIWTLISLSSNRSPVKVFLTYFTFSPGTGYNRILIWEYGSAEVMRHPLFGIGLGEWVRAPWMSNSMDNFWLATAVRYGLPSMLALVGVVVVQAWQLGNLRLKSNEEIGCRSAWITCIIGLSIAGCTVHYWNALFALFSFLLGSGMWLLSPEPNRFASGPSASHLKMRKRLQIEMSRRRSHA